MDISGRYEQKLKELSDYKSKIHQRVIWLAWSRLIAVILLSILGVVLFRIQSYLLLPYLPLALIAFVFLVKYHLRKEDEEKRINIKISFCEKEILHCKHQFSAFDGGKEFIDPHHEFSGDLDIFGDHSLFQFINRSTTAGGRQRLATYLRAPLLNKQEILERQHALRELASLTFWRDEFLTNCKLAEHDWQLTNSDHLWARHSLHSSTARLKIMGYVASILSIGLTVLYALSIVSWTFLLLYILFPIMVISFHATIIRKAHSSLTRRGKQLRAYVQAFELIAKQEFKSNPLRDIQSKTLGTENSAIQAITSLARISDAMDTRLNPFMSFILNYFLLWDIRQVARFEEWKRKWGDKVCVWFESLSEADALISLAIFHYNHTDYPFPELSAENTIIIAAKDAGHPLIPAERRVNNPIEVNGLREFTVITGANMAGKSTYLRTVGINLLLAMAGCPVAAQSLLFTPLKLHTGILTLDSLARNESFFLAELLRLKSILDRLRAGERLFILLDEVLKGTNTKDKQEGSRQLLQVLSSMEVSGMIATHDTSLGEADPGKDARLVNVCFEASIEGDDVFYDYQLKPGIASKMTAAVLMRKLGITKENTKARNEPENPILPPI